MKKEFPLKTNNKECFIDITDKVQETVSLSDVSEGIANIFVPHTTAGLTINENADPDVQRDLKKGLSSFIPENGFAHIEGNSPAHIRSSLFGVSLQVIIDHGKLVLGTWQGIYFCEFDGPRNRRFIVKVIGG